MIINIDLDINLFDGDTELESGEMFQVERINITEDSFNLYMSNGDIWDGANLTPYERDLIINEVSERMKEVYNSVLETNY
jgi:hypothetical protein